MTAREAYNIVKAAEAGEKGNPEKYRNYQIPPYVNMQIKIDHPMNLSEILKQIRIKKQERVDHF